MRAIELIYDEGKTQSLFDRFLARIRPSLRSEFAFFDGADRIARIVAALVTSSGQCVRPTSEADAKTGRESDNGPAPPPFENQTIPPIFRAIIGRLGMDAAHSMVSGSHHTAKGIATESDD